MVFGRLARAKLTINLAKCEFGRLQSPICASRVKPVHVRVEAIWSFSAPSPWRLLRHFQWQVTKEAFVAPLTGRLSPKTPFHWLVDCQHTLNHIKALFTNAPVPAAPVF